MQNLLEGMLKNVLITNEQARIACGAPDFILTRKDIPVGYIEAKDIGEPLTGSKHKKQFNHPKSRNHLYVLDSSIKKSGRTAGFFWE